MGVTATGMKELAQAIDRLPDTVTAALRRVALNSARRIQASAHAGAPVNTGIRSKHTEGQPHLRDSIIVEEVPGQKLFRVWPNTPWLPNLGLWIERGTVHLRARPFMRPAGDAEHASYQSNMVTAADRAATEALKE